LRDVLPLLNNPSSSFVVPLLRIPFHYYVIHMDSDSFQVTILFHAALGFNLSDEKVPLDVLSSSFFRLIPGRSTLSLFLTFQGGWLTSLHHSPSGPQWECFVLQFNDSVILSCDVNPPFLFGFLFWRVSFSPVFPQSLMDRKVDTLFCDAVAYLCPSFQAQSFFFLPPSVFSPQIWLRPLSLLIPTGKRGDRLA